MIAEAQGMGKVPVFDVGGPSQLAHQHGSRSFYFTESSEFIIQSLLHLHQ